MDLFLDVLYAPDIHCMWKGANGPVPGLLYAHISNGVYSRSYPAFSKCGVPQIYLVICVNVICFHLYTFFAH